MGDGCRFDYRYLNTALLKLLIGVNALINHQLTKSGKVDHPCIRNKHVHETLEIAIAPLALEVSWPIDLQPLEPESLGVFLSLHKKKERRLEEERRRRRRRRRRRMVHLSFGGEVDEPRVGIGSSRAHQGEDLDTQVILTQSGKFHRIVMVNMEEGLLRKRKSKEKER